MKVLLVFGTRPEAIKLCPIVHYMRTQVGFDPRVCVTGQHRHLLDQVLEAFKVNSIAYLLKPVTFPDLSASLEKLQNLRDQLVINESKLDKLRSLANDTAPRNYKNRFMVKLGDHIRSLTTDQIIIFFADGGSM